VGAAVAGERAFEVRDELLGAGLVVNATGPDTIRLLPPLTVSEDEVGRALEILGRTLG
jgi:4-aminobutyrate aminotransferase-like enzyme